MNRSELKVKAKESLKGHYGEAIKIYLLFFCISLLSSIIINNELLNLIISFVIMGFYLGYYSFFLKISRNEEVTWKELFNKNNLFFTSIIVSILVGIFTFLWSLLFIIPGIIAAIGYSMVYYVALDNPDLGVMDIIKKSKEIMNGHKMDFFILNFSFIGWSILSIFTLGILTLWLVPYMQVTYANFYNEIIKEN